MSRGGSCEPPLRFHSNISRESGVAVAQELARRRPGAIALAEGLGPVNDNRAVTLGALYPAPFAARQIMYDFTDPLRLDAEAVEVVHHDIRRRAFTQHATIAEARRMCRQCGHTVVRLFERNPLLVAHHPA